MSFMKWVKTISRNKFLRLINNNVYKILRYILSLYNPPYQLILTEEKFDKIANGYIYTFKLYGGHDFIRLSHKEIKDDHKIIRLIHPRDLIHINIKEYNFRLENNKYKIIECLRNNHYKISNGNNIEIYSGEKICENIDMFKNIDSYDLYKISYETGFLHGRKSTIKMIEGRKNQQINTKKNSDGKILFFNKGK